MRDRHPDYDREKERVIAVACLTRDGRIFTLPPPARHADLIFRLMPKMGVPELEIHLCEQGFATNYNWFVSRISARHVAYYQGQLLPRAGKTRQLFSEDVW